MIIIDGVRYSLWTPKDEEKQFHPIVREHSREIFGENSLYFDVKHVLKTASGIGSIPDAYVINLSRPAEWYVVENELASHPVYDHVVKQLTKFINGIENQNARSQILEMLYETIDKDGVLKATVKKLTASDDIHHFLTKLLSTSPRIVIIIDQKTPEVQEACRVLKYQTDIIEFKTYVRENAETVHAYLFEPLSGITKPLQPRRPLARANWEEKLSWCDEKVKEITRTLTNRTAQLDNVSHRPSGTDYIFYREISGRKYAFVGLFLTKSALKVRIRTDPILFNDPKKWTGDKEYHWFFKAGEKEFKMTDKDQLDYAMGLIKQSYNLAG
jgi:predicted transport protein